MVDSVLEYQFCEMGFEKNLFCSLYQADEKLFNIWSDAAENNACLHCLFTEK